MGQNLKYVGPGPKIYGSKIIYKINLNGRIVISAPYLSVRALSPLRGSVIGHRRGAGGGHHQQQHDATPDRSSLELTGCAPAGCLRKEGPAGVGRRAERRGLEGRCSWWQQSARHDK